MIFNLDDKAQDIAYQRSIPDAFGIPFNYKKTPNNNHQFKHTIGYVTANLHIDFDELGHPFTQTEHNKDGSYHN
jgi:hypothetical protein